MSPLTHTLSLPLTRGAKILAAKKPTQKSVSEKHEVTVNKIFSRAVSQSPLFKLPWEIRQKIWEMVLPTPGCTLLDILPLRLCPHVDALEIRAWYPPISALSAEVKARESSDHKNNEPRESLYLRLHLLYVCKAVQLEILTVLFSKHELQFPDIRDSYRDSGTRLRVDLTESPLNAKSILASRTRNQKRENQPSKEDEDNIQEEELMRSDSDVDVQRGLDLMMKTFRPFCSMIKSMRIDTWVDTDCIDEGKFRGRENKVTELHTQPVSDLRTELASNLVNPNLSNIFSSLRHLRIDVHAMEEGDRPAPRYLVEKEFLSLFRPLGRLRTLTTCAVTFASGFTIREPPHSSWWDVRYLRVGESADNAVRMARRRHGQYVCPNLLDRLKTQAEAAIVEGNANYRPRGVGHNHDEKVDDDEMRQE